MNVLDRVQGCNRVIVQGRREIEDQQMGGRGFGSAAPAEERKQKKKALRPRVGKTCWSLGAPGGRVP